MHIPAHWIQKNGNIVPHVRIIMLALAYSALGLYLYQIGQHLICTCNTVLLWDTTNSSQHIADSYSLSHFLHGVIIVFVWRTFFPKLPMRYAFLAGIVTAVTWEVIEHSQFVLERFRSGTVSQGYFGDAIINSMSDAVIMSIGLYTATRMYRYQMLILFVVFELISVYISHDSLVLSTIMLIHPIPAIKAWQLGATF